MERNVDFMGFNTRKKLYIPNKLTICGTTDTVVADV